ncbi:class I SAM-dependent methyltransferase [Allocoleopsis franciscana]|uniref:Methylase involved in ubiquinone/menaquinone biosynthesis n=1 Tax=Allocoleopsis franciscana PCC 7113 TaxID=1173027 RepID=K9WGF7_9CYAN|nr:methyltransferase domain-containing protein [Allocoleopsis franciscana]AFZ18874.1 methylase involved in ubiquinone/menaquinone biosynthesis [Allocoleopsis franciscana PCC 7113]
MAEPFPFYQGYDRYRARYPKAAIAQILSGITADAILAADIGAGTGIGSRLLADRGVQVIAVEPGAEMRQGAIPHDGVKFVEGSAEQVPLGTASVDLVTSFQAFHWFDFTQSLKEFHRILKPGGRLALVWNFWDQRDAVSQTYTKYLYQASQPADRYLKPADRFSLKGGLNKLRYQLFWSGVYLPYFNNLRRYTFTFEQFLNLEGLIGLARSQGSTPQSGMELERLESKLAELCDRDSNPQGQVRLLYTTRLYLAQRN